MTGAATLSSTLGVTGAITGPTINATTALQVNGTNINTLYQPIPWVCVLVSAGGSVTTSSGQKTITVTKTVTGKYPITWSGAHASLADYIPILTIRSGGLPGFITYVGTSSTGLTVYTMDASQAFADYSFSLMIPA